MNAIDAERVYVRSLATRARKGELSGAIREGRRRVPSGWLRPDIVETSGIGQATPTSPRSRT